MRNPLWYGIRNPLWYGFRNPESWNPESRGRYPESRTFMDSLTWGEKEATVLCEAAVFTGYMHSWVFSHPTKFPSVFPSKKYFYKCTNFTDNLDTRVWYSHSFSMLSSMSKKYSSFLSSTTWEHCFLCSVHSYDLCHIYTSHNFFYFWPHPFLLL